ncbi:nuclear transport factor 2 family protein [Streptosporangium sp. NPDC000509]|uniref:nuclear transport factor 2 family protein n=1 Tax=Streptosporangium sp. NPDC000509 TaxID=3366186 RepID=UPI0036892D10
MTNGMSQRSRRTFVTAGIAGGLMMVSGTAGASAAPHEDAGAARSGRSARERRNRAAVLRAFERQNAGGDIYEILHDDVKWTIVNGRTYTSKAEFLAQGSAPIMDRLASTLVMTIHDLWSEGDTVIIRFAGDATAIDGVEYHNEYCWVWRLQGGRVMRSHAYLDMIAVRELVDRVELD